MVARGMDFICSRIQSFGFAIEGIRTLLVSQRNAQIHLVATIIAISGGIWLQITTIQWALLGMSISLVWMAEAFNTALEFLADSITQEQHPLIKKAKDLAAAGVLFTAFNSLITALCIFCSPR